MTTRAIGAADHCAKTTDLRDEGSGATGRIDLSQIPKTIPAAVAILAEAYDYATSLNENVWQFALELPNLCLAGVSINDLRWLACNNYIEQGEELEPDSRGRRVFRSYQGLGFTQSSCFVLTQAGIEFAGQVQNSDADMQRRITNTGDLARLHLASAPEDGETIEDATLPHWDQDRRELRHMGTVVKQFRKPSPNQVMVLQAFEEEGWPTRVDDPLPPVSELDPKRRLHDTIKSLNRHQKAKTIRFLGDGQGEGIIWEPR